MNKDETLEKPTNRWSLICKGTEARATTFYIYNTSLLNRPNVAWCYVLAFVYIAVQQMIYLRICNFYQYKKIYA